MPSKDWCLFIDESGNFDDERSVVAGLLLRESDSPRLDRRLRDLLRAAIPFGAWPVHAAHLRVATFPAAAWAVDPGQAPPGLASELSEAASRIEAIAPELWREAVADASQPRQLEPHRKLTRCVQAADRQLHARLVSISSQLLAGITGKLDALARSYGDGIFTVAASIGPEDARSPTEDRYLRALEALLERVLAVLRGEGQQTVWVIAAERDVRGDPRLPAMALRPQDVGGRAAAAQSFPLGLPGSVRLVPGMPRKYDATVHGGLMLADFLANSLRLPVAQARHWPGLVVSAHSLVPVPVERTTPSLRGAGPLPTIAAEGMARSAITAVMHDPSSRPPLPGHPGWVSEQAGRWIAARRLAEKGGAQ